MVDELGDGVRGLGDFVLWSDEQIGDVEAGDDS